MENALYVRMTITVKVVIDEALSPAKLDRRSLHETIESRTPELLAGTEWDVAYDRPNDYNAYAPVQIEDATVERVELAHEPGGPGGANGPEAL